MSELHDSTAGALPARCFVSFPSDELPDHTPCHAALFSFFHLPLRVFPLPPEYISYNIASFQLPVVVFGPCEGEWVSF